MADLSTHPLTLSFRDAAIEAAWWRHFAAERGRIVRGAVILLVLLISAFGIVDVLAFAPVAETMLKIRLVCVILLVLPLPLVLGPDERLARYGQPVLFYLSIVSLGGLLPMGWALAPIVTEDQLRVAIPALLLGLISLYGVSGLRFALAAPLGIGSVIGFFLVFRSVEFFESTLWWTALAFTGGSSVVGLVVCFSIEYYARRDFLRQRELEAERIRSEDLLRNIVPDVFAARLAREPGPLLERYPDVTIVFATLVDFEELTRDLGPLQAVALLDRLVGAFDDLAREHGVERIKTIGATYMAGAGLPVPRGDAPVAAAKLVLAMRAAVEIVAADVKRPLRLRVGLATGPVMAGVIGRVRYAFDCWGDTANTASRMDSHGLAGRVQLDGPTAERLAERFRVVSRGLVDVKGKGSIETFWLEGYR